MVRLRTVYPECLVHAPFERRIQFSDPESLLLCCLRTKSRIQGKSLAIETESPVQSQDHVDFGAGSYGRNICFLCGSARRDKLPECRSEKGEQKHDQRNRAGLQGGKVSEALCGQHPYPELSGF